MQNDVNHLIAGILSCKRDLRAVLPRLARAALHAAVTAQQIDFEARRRLIAVWPQLQEPRATFVTLRKHGRLRGCIGSLVTRRALIDDIIANTIAAALKDNRFNPVARNELDDIDIEISLLSAPRPLPYEDIADLRRKLRPGVDGVILQLNGRRATFLPLVWEQLPDFDIFFDHLCRKAGLPGNCLASHPDIHVYQAEKITEAR